MHNVIGQLNVLDESARKLFDFINEAAKEAGSTEKKEAKRKKKK